MMRTLVFALLLMSLEACQHRSRVKTAIEEPKMVLIMADLALIEAQYNKLADVDTNAREVLEGRTAAILKKHQVSQSQFREAMTQWQSDLEGFERLSQTVYDTLLARKERINKP
jgi:hypothetical protein